MKRSYLIIIAVVVVLIAGFLLFLFFTRNQSGTVSPTGTNGTLPSTGTQNAGGGSANNGSSGSGSSGNVLGSGAVGGATKFGVVSNEPVLDYSVDAQNNMTVVEPDGKIAAIVGGQPSFLSSSAVQNLTSGSFSYDGKKVLVGFGDPSNPQTSVFDLVTKAWIPLASGITYPVWSPSDYRIAYLKLNSDGTESIMTLDVSKPTNQSIALFTLNVQGVSLAWPDKNQMVLQDRPSVYAPGSAWLFNLATKTLVPATLQTTGLETAWSNTTSSMGLLFESGTGGYGGSLSLFNSSSGATQALSFLTLPSKCDFHYDATATTSIALVVTTGTASTTKKANSGTAASSTTVIAPAPYLALYCAVPTTPTVLGSAPEPDSYNQLAVFTADNFYEIRMDTGATENIFSPSQSIDGTGLKVFNNVLYFVNRYDSKLYAISL